MTTKYCRVFCHCVKCDRTADEIVEPQTPAIWPQPTPWAIECPEHGLVYLSNHEYNRQLNLPLMRWTCPHIGCAYDVSFSISTLEAAESELPSSDMHAVNAKVLFGELPDEEGQVT